MTERGDDTPANPAHRISVGCATCGERAETAELVPAGVPHPKAGSTAVHELAIYTSFASAGSLIVDGVSGKSAWAIGAQQFDQIARLFDRGDWRGLYQIDPEWVSTYCPRCQAHYCSAHWRQIVDFDDGFYDCTRGCCPNGHWRVLAD